VVEVTEDLARVQMFGNNSGIKVGDQIFNSGSKLCVELGPGVFSKIFRATGMPEIQILITDGSTFCFASPN
jgi:vacuolar-type H+-ATPase catalytic subunit A/Vma1